MPTVLYTGAIVWFVLQAVVLAIHAARTRRVVQRALALETLSAVMVAALAVVALYHEQPGYLDIALVIAMLGFVQTVATARLLERRRDLP